MNAAMDGGWNTIAHDTRVGRPIIRHDEIAMRRGSGRWIDRADHITK